MKPLLLLPLLALLVTTTFLSCKKDDDDTDARVPTCRITNVVYYDSSGAPDGNAAYTYTDNRLSKVQLSDFYYTLEYNGNNISRSSYFFSAAAEPEVYDQVSYNGDGTVSRIEKFQTTGPADSSFFRFDFTYAGGKLSKVSLFSVANNVPTLEEEFTYTYTGNNITSALYSSPSDPGASATLNYTVDNNGNYLTEQAQALLTDPFFVLNSFYAFGLSPGIFLPLAFSANNTTEITIDGSPFVTIGYTQDSNQNLKNLTLNNELFASYTFTCQ